MRLPTGWKCPLLTMVFLLSICLTPPVVLAGEVATYRIETVIDAPAEFIYPYLIEEDKIARWNRDEDVVVDFPRGLEPRVGKQIHVTLEIPTHPWILMEIVTLDPGREVRTSFIDGVLRGEYVYLLEPLEEGRTRLAQEMRLRAKGFFFRFAWLVYGEGMYRKKMRNFLDEIKKVVESDWRPARSAVSGTDRRGPLPRAECAVLRPSAGGSAPVDRR